MTKRESGKSRLSLAFRLTSISVLEIMFIRELADRLQEPTPVIACTVHPGSSRSSLFRVYESTWYSRTLTQLGYMLLCARSCEEGSKTLVHAVMSDQNGEMHGKYLSNCQLTEEDDFLFTSEGKAFSHRLWVIIHSSVIHSTDFCALIATDRNR